MRLALLICLGIAMMCPPTIAEVAISEEVVEIPVTVTSWSGHDFQHSITVTIFRDKEKALSPFLILNHGRAVREADRRKMGRSRYLENSRYFVSKGFAVFVPTRVGYGITGGDDVEYSGDCLAKDYRPAYEVAARQSMKVIAYLRDLPYIDATRGIVVGQSFGGMTAIALAAKNLPGVVAAINFAGGGGGDPVNSPGRPCRPDRVAELYSIYGATSRIPTLWLYSENDRYFGIENPHLWFKGFVQIGGIGSFVQLPPYKNDGHPSFTGNTEAWRPAVDEFLRTLGF